MAGDMSEDDPGRASANDWSAVDAHSPADSTKSDSEHDDGNPNAPSQPIQKRRRVTRACDECRRKKIKCDGKQPCTHCSVYSYECTYDKPSNRRRNPAPQYIEALEGRLQRAESMLRKFMPDVDLADPSLDPAIQQEFHNREKARAAQTAKIRPDHPPSMPDPNDTKITSMIDSIGQLDMDDKGGFDYHGISSGAVFLKRMKDHFRGMLGPVSKVPFLPRTERHTNSLANLDSPSPAPHSPFSSVSVLHHELPPKETAQKLCHFSLSCATCLVRIVHVPSFYEKLDKIYDKPFETLNDEENHFVGLVFSILALGCMYSTLQDPNAEKEAHQAAIEEGIKYYSAARSHLQDVTQCRDLTSIQALLFLILFLQATSNLSGCYSFVGIALRSALRIGLHRDLQHEQIGAIENEIRRRVFYVIRQMDIYVSTLLGFPLMLHADDIDQQYPTEVDDEYITPDGIIHPPIGTPSFFQAFNSHTRLMEILAKITKYVYPMQGIVQTGLKGDKRSPAYQISYARIKEIEGDLHTWFEKLPETWRPSADGPIEVVRVRHLLRFAYAHVQLVLYRPFLHFVSPRTSQGTKVDELSYACAAAAISVSRNIVHIGLEIRKQRVLSGPYWFMLYTEFFAVLSLVFYAIENPEKPGSAEVLADAWAGRRMIAELADKTQSAERVTKALETLFDQLPENLDQLARPVSSKKRPAPASRSGQGPVAHGPMLQSRSSSSSIAEELRRSRAGVAPNVMFSPSNAYSDGFAPPPDQAFADQSLPPGFDFLPLDMPSRATPDSTSTGGSSHQTPYPGQGLGSANPVHKIMFPSEDPFAYPNQPMMELAFQSSSDAPSLTMSGRGADSQFLFPGAMEDIESQFFGQPPPYMVGGPQQQGNGFMDFPDPMFDPSAFGGFPPAVNMQPRMQMHMQRQQASLTPQQPPHHRPQPRHQTPAQALQRLQQQRRGQARQQQDSSQIDQLFEEQGMQADWGSFFGSGRGVFQGL
ncbi:fungal-specific transcription factor domain-containing protein [Stachybotrys elegans]|uniref:Fungal-specific transcription factor domain-containing protein n=1 Tax=Stachybotrys elegans TaxID=80388 RepID=A0A8K0WMQ0_9HYPO|nr:fungal-specific transcription factor domain-containing protein [Stachybotrys elegans]